MKIRIIRYWRNVWISTMFGRTLAEKSCHASNSSERCKGWLEYMERNGGAWVDVDLEYVFEDQFNTPGDVLGASGARIEARYIDGIDFSPEYSDVAGYMEAVAKRYAIDWPGRPPSGSIALMIRSGLIQDETNKRST